MRKILQILSQKQMKHMLQAILLLRITMFMNFKVNQNISTEFNCEPCTLMDRVIPSILDIYQYIVILC